MKPAKLHVVLAAVLLAIPFCCARNLHYAGKPPDVSSIVNYTILEDTRVSDAALVYAIARLGCDFGLEADCPAAQECADLCTNTTETEWGACVAWSHQPYYMNLSDSGLRACYLFSQFQHLLNKTEMDVSGNSTYGYNAELVASVTDPLDIDGYTVLADTKAVWADDAKLTTGWQVGGLNSVQACADECDASPGCIAFDVDQLSSPCTLFKAPLMLKDQTEPADNNVYAFKNASTDVNITIPGHTVLVNTGTPSASSDCFFHWFFWRKFEAVTFENASVKCAAFCDTVPGGMCLAWQLARESKYKFKCVLFGRNITATVAFDNVTTPPPTLKLSEVVLPSDAVKPMPGVIYGFTSNTNGTGFGALLEIPGYNLTYNKRPLSLKPTIFTETMYIDEKDNFLSVCIMACDKRPECVGWITQFGGAGCKLVKGPVHFDDLVYYPGAVWAEKGANISAHTAVPFKIAAAATMPLKPTALLTANSRFREP